MRLRGPAPDGTVLPALPCAWASDERHLLLFGISVRLLRFVPRAPLRLSTLMMEQTRSSQVRIVPSFGTSAMFEDREKAKIARFDRMLDRARRGRRVEISSTPVSEQRGEAAPRRAERGGAIIPPIVSAQPTPPFHREVQGARRSVRPLKA